MIETIDYSLLKPNPFQPKTRWPLAPESVRELADDIAANGLIHTPVGRRAPPEGGSGGVEIGVGHRRIVAWAIVHPGEPVPMDLRDLTDRQMYDYVIAESQHRLDWTAIEKGERLMDYMQRFGVTQTEAAKRFNLSQGAASNLVRLARELPAEIKPLVASRALPERFARTVVSLARIDKKCATDIGREIASTREGERDKHAGELIANFLGEHAHDLDQLSWPADWKPDTSMMIERTMEQPPACAGCPAVESALGDDFCTRPACYDAKKTLWQNRELARLSSKFAVQIAAKSETVHVLQVNWENEGAAKDLLADKSAGRDHLRLIPFDDKKHSRHDYYTQTLLGSNQVLLGSTQKAFEIKRKEREKSSGSAKSAFVRDAETPAQRARREEHEEKERQARREEKSSLRRAKADVLWLLAHTAESMAGSMVISGGVLDYCYDRMKSQGYFTHQDWPEYLDFENKLEDEIDTATGGVRENLVRQAILLGQMRREIAAYKPEEEFDVSRDIAIVSDVIGKTFRLRLSGGWHDIPIHHTDSNCWTCGTFTSQDHVTKIDESKGWQTDAAGRVTCSDECRQAKVTVAATRKAKPKPKAKTAKQRNAAYLKSINVLAAK